MVIGISICHDTDRISYAEIHVEMLTLCKLSRIPDHISRIHLLNDLIDPYAGAFLYRFAVSDATKELCHDEPTFVLGLVRKRPLVFLIALEILSGSRSGIDLERLTRRKSDIGSRSHCRIGIGPLVRRTSGVVDVNIRTIEVRSGRSNKRIRTSNLVDHDGGTNLRKGARDACLQQVLVLVVVDVEIVEERDVATPVSTNRVVLQVHDDTEKISLVLHDLDCLDSGDLHLLSQLGSRTPQATTSVVPSEQQVCERLQGRV